MSRAEEVRRALVLYSKSKGRYVDMQRLLIQFGMECFLRRLAASTYNDAFVLKGAMSFAIHMDGARNTKDVDFQIYGRHDAASLRHIFSAICSIVEDDGILFFPDQIVVEAAGEDREYPGFVVQVPTQLGEARMSLQFDVGFGEMITPEPARIDFPCLINLRPPRIRIYPIESVISEKFEAIVSLGMRNGRMKDFYDIAEFADKIQFNGSLLSQAIQNTFARRGTAVPVETPVALTSIFFGKKKKVLDFKAFLQRHSLPKTKTLECCCQTITRFLMPICAAVAAKEQVAAEWIDGCWRDKSAPSE